MWTLAMCPGAGRLRKTLAALRAQPTRSSSPVSARTHTHSLHFVILCSMPLPRLKRQDKGRLLAHFQQIWFMRVKAAMQLGGNIGDIRMMDDGTKDNKKSGAIQGQVIAGHILSWRPIKKVAPRIVTYLRAYTITHTAFHFAIPLFNAITRTHNGKRKDAWLVDWPRTLNLIVLWESVGDEG